MLPRSSTMLYACPHWAVRGCGTASMWQTHGVALLPGSNSSAQSPAHSRQPTSGSCTDPGICDPWASTGMCTVAGAPTHPWMSCLGSDSPMIQPTAPFTPVLSLPLCHYLPHHGALDLHPQWPFCMTDLLAGGRGGAQALSPSPPITFSPSTYALLG